MLPYFKNNQSSCLGRKSLCTATCGYTRTHAPIPLSTEENSLSAGLHTEIPLHAGRLLQHVTATLFQVYHMSAQALESQISSERIL